MAKSKLLYNFLLIFNLDKLLRSYEFFSVSSSLSFPLSVCVPFNLFSLHALQPPSHIVYHLLLCFLFN